MCVKTSVINSRGVSYELQAFHPRVNCVKGKFLSKFPDENLKILRIGKALENIGLFLTKHGCLCIVYTQKKFGKALFYVSVILFKMACMLAEMSS